MSASISLELTQILAEYLRRGRPALLTNPEEPALFLTRLGGRLRTQDLSLIPTRRAATESLPPCCVAPGWPTERRP